MQSITLNRKNPKGKKEKQKGIKKGIPYPNRNSEPER